MFLPWGNLVIFYLRYCVLFRDHVSVARVDYFVCPYSFPCVVGPSSVFPRGKICFPSSDSAGLAIYYRSWLVRTSSLVFIIYLLGNCIWPPMLRWPCVTSSRYIMNRGALREDHWETPYVISNWPSVRSSIPSL